MLWRSQSVEGATWEAEAVLKAKYPNIFFSDYIPVSGFTDRERYHGPSTCLWLMPIQNRWTTGPFTGRGPLHKPWKGS
ncbi:hypothetical protein MTR67_035352 [Solanum verrucosum]|uniref:Uncharacterized protein n=1 Tax=Solanum verrucosum TaxID=315347 RepID=A0AAF0U9T4_SOLVR|nr:hypothetical protein MTR67_035352 [Solanum verrucosum]